MSDRQRALFFSILIMAAISGAVAVIVISLLYRTALEEQRTRLSEVTLSQARLLEAMMASGLDSATVMRILRHTHESYKKPGHTGVLSLARREGEHIVFLLHYGNGALALPPSLPFSANRDTPIARAYGPIREHDWARLSRPTRPRSL